MSKLELIAKVSYSARCVTLQESYNLAYVGVWPNPRVVILDIAQPAQPRIIGESAKMANIPLDIAVQGSYAYVVEENGLHIIDASTPNRPKEVSFYPISLKPLGIAVSRGSAYIATEKGGLRIIDVSSPLNPREVDHLELPGYTYGIALRGDYIYVSGWGGLFILKSYFGLKHEGYCRTPKEAYGVTVMEDYAYIACDGAGLRIINVSVPSYPEEVGSCKTDGWAIGIAVTGKTCFLADGTAVRVIDISRPSRPVEIAPPYPTSPMGAADIATSGNYIYIADREGLLVLRFVR
jgi:hypothetical protein